MPSFFLKKLGILRKTGNNDMSLEMLGILSKLVTAQYIVPFTQNKRCVRSAIVYYDKDFVDTAEELRRALQLICGSDPPVGKESFNYEGHSETESIKKFKETFGQFLADSVHNSSLWIISVISHGHAGKIHLTHDPNHYSECSALRIKTILQLVREQILSFKEHHCRPPLPTVS